MEDGQIYMKNGVIYHHEELEIKHEPIDKLPVLPLTENDNILNEEVHIKDEPIDQRYLLPSSENRYFTNSSPIKTCSERMGWLFGDSKSVLDSTMPSEIDIIQHWIYHYDHGNEGFPKKMCKESKTKVTLETVKSVINHVQNLYPNREIMSQESVRSKLIRLILKAEGLILKHKVKKI